MKQNLHGAEILISYVLRGGLILALAIVMYGGVLFLWQDSHQVLNYSTFKAASLKDLRQIIENAGHHRSEALIQMGILVMIATPVLRVLSCLLLFAWQRDSLYAALASAVLLILCYSFFS